MKIIITEEQKKKLFVPIDLDKRDADFEKNIKAQSDKFLIDNDIKSLEYVIKVRELWGSLDYADIENAVIYEGKVILNKGKELNFDKGWTTISHSDFIDYAHIMSSYFTFLIAKHNPRDLVVNDLKVDVTATVGSIKTEVIFTLFEPGGTVYDYQNKKDMKKVVHFYKPI